MDRQRRVVRLVHVVRVIPAPYFTDGLDERAAQHIPVDVEVPVPELVQPVQLLRAQRPTLIEQEPLLCRQLLELLLVYEPLRSPPCRRGLGV